MMVIRRVMLKVKIIHLDVNYPHTVQIYIRNALLLEKTAMLSSRTQFTDEKKWKLKAGH